MSRIITFFMVSAICVTQAQASMVILDGDPAQEYYAPHHFGNGALEASHYLIQTGDAHHMAWFSTTPSTPGTTTIFYDFRSPAIFTGGMPNVITAAQKLMAVAAFNAWSAATDGGSGPKLVFVQSAAQPLSNIINVGTGPLGGPLGFGGGVFNHSGATHSITFGGATQSSAAIWDTTIGNGNPGGTIDYFTVVAQEIGHALGLGHDNSAQNIMNGTYTAEIAALTAVDIAHIRSIYGVSSSAVIPEPSSSMIFLGLGLCFAAYGWRKRKRHQRI